MTMITDTNTKPSKRTAKSTQNKELCIEQHQTTPLTGNTLRPPRTMRAVDKDQHSSALRKKNKIKEANIYRTKRINSVQPRTA